MTYPAGVAHRQRPPVAAWVLALTVFPCLGYLVTFVVVEFLLSLSPWPTVIVLFATPALIAFLTFRHVSLPWRATVAAVASVATIVWVYLLSLSLGG